MFVALLLSEGLWRLLAEEKGRSNVTRFYFENIKDVRKPIQRLLP